MVDPAVPGPDGDGPRRREGPVQAPVRPVVVGLAVAVALAALSLAGRLTDMPSERALSAPAPLGDVDGPPVTRPAYPASLRRPLRLPSLGPAGTCPLTRPVRAWPYRRDVGANAVAVGDGPVLPVFVRDPAGDGLRPLWISWQAMRPLGGTAIVRARRLGPFGAGPAAFDEGGVLLPVKVLDEALSSPVDVAGRSLPFWMSFRLDGGRGCYGLQIDGPAFTQVVVVELTA
jgi:hypothetical protein